MAVLRFLAGLLLLAAVIAFIDDATPWISSFGPFAVTPLGTHWQEIAPNSLEAARQAVGGSAVAFVWDGVIAPLLRIPTFALFGFLGALFGWLGRHRKRVNVFAN